MIIFRCSCNYFSSEIGFPVCYYPIIHSFLTLLSLRLAELGPLEAFHYSSNNSKEFCCSVCCIPPSSLSLCPLVPITSSPQVQNLRSFPSLVSILSRSVTYSVCLSVCLSVSLCVLVRLCLFLC